MTYGEDRVYKKIEVIGCSGSSISEAIQTAVSKASSSVERLSWFEVSEIRGHIDKEGKVAEFQVDVKLAFQVK